MFIELLKIRLKAVFSGKSKGTDKKNSAVVKVLIYLLIAYAAGCFVFMFGAIYNEMAKAVAGTEIGWLYFVLIAFMNILLGFFSTVFAAQSQIFEAKDNELLLSMPLSTKAIVASRIATLLVIDGVEDAILGVVAIVIYSMHATISPMGIFFYVLLTIGIMFLTSVLSTLFGWIIASATSKMKNKATFTTILSLILFFAYFWIINKGETYIKTIVENGNEIAGAIKARIYPFYGYGTAITEENLAGFAVFMGITIVLFTLVVVLVGKTFIKLATTKKGIKKTAYNRKYISENSAKKALILKEQRKFFTSAPYMLNAGLGLVMMLAAAVFIVVRKSWINDMLDKIPFVGEHIGLIALMAITAFNMFNMVSAPSISLEGDSLWIAKSLPVNTKDILMAKVWNHVRICTPFSLIVSIAANYVFDMSVGMRILILIIPIASSVFIGILGVVTNLLLPKLNWADEMVAIKQSMSVLVVMCVDFIVYIAIGVSFYFFIFVMGMSEEIYSIILCVIFIIPSICMMQYLGNNGSRRFERL